MSLQSKTVKELKDMARGKVKGFSTMKKSELIKALQPFQKPEKYKSIYKTRDVRKALRSIAMDDFGIALTSDDEDTPAQAPAPKKKKIKKKITKIETKPKPPRKKVTKITKTESKPKPAKKKIVKSTKPIKQYGDTVESSKAPDGQLIIANYPLFKKQWEAKGFKTVDVRTRKETEKQLAKRTNKMLKKIDKSEEKKVEASKKVVEGLSSSSKKIGDEFDMLIKKRNQKRVVKKLTNLLYEMKANHRDLFKVRNIAISIEYLLKGDNNYKEVYRDVGYLIPPGLRKN